jgi:hypothetical protein
MAVSEDEGPDSQAQEKIHEQAGVSLTPSPTRTRTTKRQALRDQERRLLDQGSRAVDRARATTAGTFWSRLNAVAFMNSSLQFAALAVLCLFPFMIIVAAESGVTCDTSSSPASVSIRRRPETSTSSCPRDVTQ